MGKMTGLVVVFVVLSLAVLFSLQHIALGEAAKKEAKAVKGIEWKGVMEEFNKIWPDVEKEMANEIKGLSQDEIDKKLTPDVAKRTAKKLNITEEEVFDAIRKSIEQEEVQKIKQ